MKFTAFRINLFLIIAFLFLNGSESIALQKNDDLNQTAETTKKDSAESKKEYKTIKATHEEIRVTLTLEGYFEDVDATPISINTKSWGEINVITPPEHGKIVKKGDSLLEIDIEKIKKKLGEITHELSMLNLDHEILASELKREEKLNKIELAQIKRMEKYNREEFSNYKNIELPYEKKSASYDLKKYEENLSYMMEELSQLRKMYEADDLTEETEEIILKRTENEVNRMKFSLEGARIREAKSLQLEIPKAEAEKSDTYERKIYTYKANLFIKPAELRKKRLEMKKLKEEKRILAENKLDLDRDLLQLKAFSPIQGILFVGTFDMGKWSGTKLFDTKLKKGGLLKPHEEFITICPQKKIQARIKVPEKNLLEISRLKKCNLIPGTNSKEKWHAQIEKVGKFPVEPKTYDITVSFQVPEGKKNPLPGTSCKLKIITYQNKHALTLPKSSVFYENHDSDISYVYQLSEKGIPEKRIVKTGKTSNERIEIVEGVSTNTKVLKQKPDA